MACAVVVGLFHYFPCDGIICFTVFFNCHMCSLSLVDCCLAGGYCFKNILSYSDICFSFVVLAGNCCLVYYIAFQPLSFEWTKFTWLAVAVFSHHAWTNIEKTLPCLINQEFPPNLNLTKIFNRNTLKLSYICMNSQYTTKNLHSQ